MLNHSIPNQEGIGAVKSYLENSKTNSLILIISSFLWLILTLNKLTFNNKNYLQTAGTHGDKVHTELCKPIYGPLRGNIPLSTFGEEIEPVSTLH